jgi:K+-sensing histidine kinase KdpD
MRVVGPFSLHPMKHASRLLAYGFAPLSVAVAAVATAALWRFIQPSASPLFFAAVMMSAMYGGLGPGLLATALSAVATAYFFMAPRFSLDIGIDDAFRLALFAVVALLTSYIQEQRRQAEATRNRTIAELQSALAKIQTLSDLLPICPHCKRIRDEESGEWQAFETYVQQSSTLKVSHALCPDCGARVYPEYFAPGQH